MDLPLPLPRLVLLAGAAAAAAWLVYQRFFRRSKFPPLPPGPPPRFLLGNLGQLSVEDPAEDYIRWGNEYNSDVIHIKMFGQHHICLNSRQAATDLLDRRGSNYCDRPRFTCFEIMGWGLTLTFLRWGPQFKLHRRLFQTTFTQSNVKTFRPIQLHEARKAVRSLVRQPDDWLETTLLMTTSIIFRIAFGQEISSKESPYCAMSQAANEATTNGGIAGSTLVDLFPPVRYLPEWLNVSSSLRHARRSRAAIETVRDVPWDATLRDIEAGTAAPSFMKTHLEKLRQGIKSGGPGGGPDEMTLADVKGATGAVFIAGGNSTWSTVLSLLLFLTKYPEAQRRAQAEIDALVAAEARLPDFDDRARLTYLDGFVNEVIRMLPMNPLVIPHRSLNDDVYNGMHIPAGSIVFANTKAMCYDEKTYRNPHEFDPERYARGEPLPVGNFGFGRRKCPGNFLALASVYIFVATFLAVFEVEKAVGEDGQVLEPEIGLTIGLGGHPLPFKCKLKVRSPEMAALLARESDVAQ